ncbi:Hypothetical predicted protein [Mytilus galloprovincialis]|uniref:Mab-21-like nucleotidyltransferase domain-containing protein n=1 Tax=Mytilus galloprovincialis TaxID=29158 RepID=A0A8B6FG73_MYTGA|nr:Hypothetical predicted protein [Mytilus galloprovincialis]
MDRNSRNDENDSAENVHGLRKMKYWEKYGVKRFLYPGRRRYPPLVYQSEDGGIIISNDVFGLTIKQFEEMYKACLVRRKAHEQFWNGNDLKVKCLYDYLVKTLGTEIDIRKRQQLFIIQDIIQNAMKLNSGSNTIEISSGSLAEGIDLPGSDRDIMFVMKTVDVIPNVKNIKHAIHRTTLLMETDNDHPGFIRLRLIAGGDGETNFITCESFESSRNGLYLSVTKFINNINQKFPHLQLSSHGPCLSDKHQTIDCILST